MKTITLFIILASIISCNQSSNCEAFILKRQNSECVLLVQKKDWGTSGNLAMGKDVTMDNVAASTIKAFIIPPIGSVYGGISTHIFKSSGVTSSVVEGVHNQIAGDAVDNQIEQYRNYKNSQ